MSYIDKFIKYKEKYLRFKNNDSSIVINNKFNLTDDKYYNKYLKYKKKYIELTGGAINKKMRKKINLLSKKKIDFFEYLEKIYNDTKETDKEKTDKEDTEKEKTDKEDTNKEKTDKKDTEKETFQLSFGPISNKKKIKKKLIDDKLKLDDIYL